MARKTANCPACGGTVEFRSAMSLVAVCPYCSSVVARQDRHVYDQGKIAEISDSLSPLQLGLKGTWQGKAFRLIGRVQYQHSAGGQWDEWYIEFGGGRKWGWLSEAQGRFGILLVQNIKDPSAVPGYGTLQAGQSLVLGSAGEMHVSEVGLATVAAAEGELPFSPRLQTEHRFVDLEGASGARATIEYGDESPQIFVGQEATLEQLGMGDAALKQETLKQVGGAQLNCPNCAGALELIAPDAAQRVTCPNCRGLLDVTGGKLEYLETLKPPKPPLKIALGTKGRLRDVDYQVMGYLRRFVTYDKAYYWQEYLLYNPRQGYAWLVDSDDQWSLAKPISMGGVKRSYPTATYDGREFKIFQKAEATVSQVWGEFYWKVQVDEKVMMNDYIAPPFSLTLEINSSEMAGTVPVASEINATQSEYLKPEEVEQGFQLKTPLPRSWGVAPNQPNPVSSGVFIQWVLFMLGIAVIYAIIPAITGRPVDFALTVWAFLMVSLMPLGTLAYWYNFEHSRWKDSEFSPYGSSGDDDDE